jgi:small-conductance mechanosensitive channel
MQVPPELGSEFVMRLLLVAGALLTLLILARVLSRILKRSIQDPTKAFHASRTVRQVAAGAGVIVTVAIISPDTGGLMTILTVIGAGLAISLREGLMSMAGWLRIVTMSEYRIGDRIEIGGVHGDVIDIRLLRTTLMETRGWVDADQSTGRISHIPNNYIWLHAVHNYNRGFSFIWNELLFTLTFRSNWQDAQDIMLGFAGESAAIVEQQAGAEIREMSREFLIHFGILTPFVYVTVVENGVRLSLRYLCEVRKRRGTEHALTISILEAFKEHGDIEFAYPALGIWPPDANQFAPPPPAR